MQFLKRYYRECTIVLLALALIVITIINYRAKMSVDDLFKKNELIKKETERLIFINDSLQADYEQQRISFLYLLDSLDQLIPHEKYAVQDIMHKLKHYSNYPLDLNQQQKDSLWQKLKEK